MNIIYKKQCEAYKLLTLGDVFSWYDTMYMKTQNFLSESSGELYNAVNLANGEAAYFDENDAVILVKAQLVIS